MNTYTISQKSKNKHLNLSHYEFIVNSLIKFNASHPSSKRCIGKTQFLKDLASTVGTSLSNLYSIINDASITVMDSNLNQFIELSALAATIKDLRNALYLITPNLIKLMTLLSSLKLK